MSALPTVEAIPLEVILGALGIFLARIADVTFATLRLVSVMRGQRLHAWFFGFVEVLIWIVAVSAVLQNLERPIYALAYALGFATGGTVGITLENRLAMGKQVVRVFSRQGAEIARRVREAGYRATEFEGAGRSGPVSLLYLEMKRRHVPEVIAVAREVDPSCFYVVEDIRSSSVALGMDERRRGWRAAFQRK